VWLYGSSRASIVETILNGRENIMPAQERVLSPEQIRLLTAWVWGLSNQICATPRQGSRAMSPPLPHLLSHTWERVQP